MNESLFDYIRKQRIKPSNVIEKVNEWSIENCTKFIEKCNEILNNENVPRATPFSFMATTSLSGGITECSMPECRIKRIDSLARFSALYSDIVLIQNPFDRYCNIKQSRSNIKFHLGSDIMTLWKAEPLMKSNLMGVSRGINLCPACAKREIEREKDIIAKVKIGEKLLLEKYLNKIRVSCKNEKGIIALFLTGPEEIIEHSKQISIPHPKSPFFEYFKKSASTNSLITNNKVKRAILLSYIRPSIRDMLTQDLYSYTLGYNSVTDHDNDLFIRDSIETLKKNIKITQLMKGMTHSVPNIQNINLTDLVKLRKREEESLRVYRDAFGKVISRIQSSDSEEDVKSLMESEILPELNTLDMLFKKTKRNAVSSFMKKAIVGSAFISVGLYSGIIPTNIGQILAALGGLKFLDATSDDLMKIIKMPEEVEKSKYYFLWKVSRTKQAVPPLLSSIK